MKSSDLNSRLGLLLLLLVVFSMPHRANAQFAVLDPVNLVQNTFSAISEAASSISTYFVEYKESILDPLFWALANQLLESMSADIVDWINSGFEGNPAFVSNPAGYFIDAADEATGVFLSSGGPLSALCSPFSLDIRLSLALNTGSRYRQKYACTLGTVINNVGRSSVSFNSDAIFNTGPGAPRTQGTTGSFSINNNSIAAFTTNGDFYAGGWSGFLALTTEPQNNVLGAYLQAESDLLSEIARSHGNIQLDLKLGSGFLSKTKCTDVNIDPTSQDDVAVAESNVTQGRFKKKIVHDEITGQSITKYQNCVTATPGSFIANALNKQLGSSVDKLTVADEVDEIVSALFAQLVKTVLTEGFSGASQSTGGGPSIVDQIRRENDVDLDDKKDELFELMDRQANTTYQFRDLRNEALAALAGVRTGFETALACFNGKLSEPRNRSRVQSYIDEITQILSGSVLPEITAHQLLANDANERAAVLDRIYTAAGAARTTSELQVASQDFARLVSRRLITTIIEVQAAREDLDRARSTAASWNADAIQYQRFCEDLR